jgi:hypothetical protein
MNTIWQTMITATAVKAAAKIPQACETRMISRLKVFIRPSPP